MPLPCLQERRFREELGQLRSEVALREEEMERLRQQKGRTEAQKREVAQRYKRVNVPPWDPQSPHTRTQHTHTHTHTQNAF